VLAFTSEGDTVLDPYAGVASSLVAAVRHRRKALGVDRCREYVDTGLDRLRLLRAGKLKTRRAGTPVYRPTGRDVVSRVPPEWLSGNTAYPRAERR
jgi:hypothetical protein